MRPFLLFFLAGMLLLQLTALRQPSQDLDLASRLQLAATALIVLTMWRGSLLFRSGNATVDEARRLEIQRAAQHGFAALIVFGFAALLYDGVEAGTLAAGLQAALIGTIMVTQVSLIIQDRRVLRQGDD